MSTAKQIENKIKKLKRGSLIFISDFASISSYDAVRKALQRFENKKLLVRISKGIYYYPKTDAILGIVYPSINTIATAIAKRDKSRIIPTGPYAQHLLGLSNQIPMNIVFLTDGSARKIKIGKQSVVFKKTSPKNLSYKSALSSLLIQAIKSIKENSLTEIQRQQIKNIILQSGEQLVIQEDVKGAPIWLRKLITEIIK